VNAALVKPGARGMLAGLLGIAAALFVVGVTRSAGAPLFQRIAEFRYTRLHIAHVFAADLARAGAIAQPVQMVA
jgi:hypothetical protein